MAFLLVTACAAHRREAQIARVTESELHHYEINGIAPFPGVCVLNIIFVQNRHPAMPLGEGAWQMEKMSSQMGLIALGDREELW